MGAGSCRCRRSARSRWRRCSSGRGSGRRLHRYLRHGQCGTGAPRLEHTDALPHAPQLAKQQRVLLFCPRSALGGCSYGGRVRHRRCGGTGTGCSLRHRLRWLGGCSHGGRVRHRRCGGTRTGCSLRHRLRWLGGCCYGGRVRHRRCGRTRTGCSLRHRLRWLGRRLRQSVIRVAGEREGIPNQCYR